MKFLLEILDKNKHDIKNFDCGQEKMNLFLRRFALKHQNLGLSKTWILTNGETKLNQKSRVVGYFTLASQSIEPSLIKQVEQNNLPNYYLIPTILLARIAIDINFQKQKLGSKLLAKALQKALEASEKGIPAYAVILDVLDDNAAKFYQKFNFFKKLFNLDNKLFVSIKTIKKLFKEELTCS